MNKTIYFDKDGNECNLRGPLTTFILRMADKDYQFITDNNIEVAEKILLEQGYEIISVNGKDKSKAAQ